MEIKSFTSIFNDMKNWIIAKQDKLTDFNGGSVITSLVEAIAREVNALYIRCRVGYDQYLKALPYSIFKFQKKTGTFATGYVKFSRATAINSVTQIPSGTIVLAGSYQFSTTGLGTILANAVDSDLVPATSLIIGLDYNVDAGLINIISSTLPADITTVTNPLKFIGGTNTETEASFLQRFRDFISGLSRTNRYGLISGGKTSSFVRSVSVVEHFPPIDNIWNATVYVDDGTGSTSSAALADVTSIINGDGTQVLPGYRACGVNVRVLAPTVVPVDIQATITTKNTDTAVAQYDAKNAIISYLNGLLIGDAVVLTTLILLLRRIAYITDVKITSPTDNIILGSSQIARYNSAIITVIAQ